MMIHNNSQSNLEKFEWSNSDVLNVQDFVKSLEKETENFL